MTLSETATFFSTWKRLPFHNINLKPKRFAQPAITPSVETVFDTATPRSTRNGQRFEIANGNRSRTLRSRKRRQKPPHLEAATSRSTCKQQPFRNRPWKPQRHVQPASAQRLESATGNRSPSLHQRTLGIRKLPSESPARNVIAKATSPPQQRLKPFCRPTGHCHCIPLTLSWLGRSPHAPACTLTRGGRAPRDARRPEAPLGCRSLRIPRGRMPTPPTAARR